MGLQTCVKAYGNVATQAQAGLAETKDPGNNEVGPVRSYFFPRLTCMPSTFVVDSKWRARNKRYVRRKKRKDYLGRGEIQPVYSCTSFLGSARTEHLEKGKLRSTSRIWLWLYIGNTSPTLSSPGHHKHKHHKSFESVDKIL